MLKNALGGFMLYWKPEHLDNIDYLKTFTMLMNVYKQCTASFVYCETFVAEVRRDIDAAIVEASG